VLECHSQKNRVLLDTRLLQQLVRAVAQSLEVGAVQSVAVGVVQSMEVQ